MLDIVVIGYGGHGHVVGDLVQSIPTHFLLGYLDDQFGELTIDQGMYIGSIQNIHKLIAKFPNLKVVIAIGDNAVRKRIVEQLDLPLEYYGTLIHPTAVVSISAKIGRGTVIMPHSVVNARSTVGNHVVINTGAVVEHDNRIADYVHLSPHVTLTGGVQVGKGTHVGAGASVIPNVSIGQWSVIGAGSTVINSVPSDATAVGVPAKQVKNNAIEGV